MKNPFTQLKQFFAQFGKIKGKKLEAQTELKPEDELKYEVKNPFEHHAKTGGKKIVQKNELEAKKKAKRKIKARIQKYNIRINRTIQ